MSAFNHEKNVTHLFIAKGIARTSSVTPATLADGEVAFFSRGGSKTLGGASDTYPAASESNGLVIMQGRSGTNPNLKSPVIIPSNIKRITATAYAAAAEQIDYIGYNGTSGSIDVINDNVYMVRLLLKGAGSFEHNQYKIIDAPYVSTATATQALIAAGLTEILVKTIERQYEKPIHVARVHSNAGSATTAATGTITATRGSKVLSCSGGTPSTDFTAGDYVRFGTATTAPVYLVTAVDDTGNGTITIDIPYQGATGTFTAGNAEFITAALAAAGDFGIKLLGRELLFTVGKFEYRKVRFETKILDFGVTTVTESQGASEGTGEPEQIQQLEWFTQGNENVNSYRWNQGPAPTFRADTDTTTTYSLLTIEYDGKTEGGVNTPVSSPCTVVIALDRVASDFSGDTNIEKSAGNNTTSVLDAVNSLIVTILGGTALTNAGVY